MRLIIIMVLSALCFGISKEEWAIQQYDQKIDSLSKIIESTPRDSVFDLSIIENEIIQYKVYRQKLINQIQTNNSQKALYQSIGSQQLQNTTNVLIAKKAAKPYNGGIMIAGQKIKLYVTLSVIGGVLGLAAAPAASKSGAAAIGLSVGGFVFNMFAIYQLWSAGDELENTTGIGRVK